MKNNLTLTTILICICSIFFPLQAQNPTYEARLMNGAFTSSNAYEFDIYVKRTGSVIFEVDRLQVGIIFNNCFINGGTALATYVSGTSEMNASQIPNIVSIGPWVSGKRTFRIAPIASSGPGAGTIISSTGYGTRLGRFRISTTASSFSNCHPEFQWNFSSNGGHYITIFFAYVDGTPTNITNSRSHYEDLCYINLNEIPTYEARLINDSLIDSNTYEFDIYLKATNSVVFTLSYARICLLFNNLISGGGHLSSTYKIGSSQLSFWQTPGNPDISNLFSGKRVWILTIPAQPDLGMCTPISSSGMGTRVGRFKIINNSGSFAPYRPNLSWNFDDITYGFRTQIYFGYYIPLLCIGTIDLTKPSVHYNNLSNPILPVELVSFTANLINKRKVELNWTTATETNNYGFEVERKCLTQTLSKVEGLDNWERIGFVAGSGNSSSAKHYSFIDNQLSGGNKFAYRLKQIDHDGTISYSSIQEVELTLSKYELTQNYPNPFNPTTTIEYTLPQAGDVSLTLYNLLGEKVEEIVNEYKESGIYKVDLDGSNLTSGVYIYVLRANGNIISKKMTILR